MVTKILRLGPFGMFANVNEVISQLHMADKKGYNFIIDWNKSPYKDELKQGDPWTYFFEYCFDETNPNPSDVLDLLGSSTDSDINIMRPRLYENIPAGPMLLPKDRRLPHKIISKYLKLKPEMYQTIEDFSRAELNGYVIGLHLRGPGRNDGGTSRLKRRYKLKNDVPFGLYFRYIDRHIDAHPESKIFVCSDSQMVIDECTSNYGDRVLTYESTRSNFGEMHSENTDNIKKYSGYKLGVDVIAEAYLMSRTDYFVHGNSNVSNFVLCLNPDLASQYVYEEDEHGSLMLRLLNLLPLRLRRSSRKTKWKVISRTRRLFATR